LSYFTGAGATGLGLGSYTTQIAPGDLSTATWNPFTVAGSASGDALSMQITINMVNVDSGGGAYTSSEGTFYVDSVTIVPEPSTYALAGLGLFLVVMKMRGRSKTAGMVGA
jgi:hypothetical protein